MPCPYFSPNQPLAETGWFRPPRAPLGSLHGGKCNANAEAAPDDHHLCNFGYARGVCPHFPADAPFDAVRFTKISCKAHVTELLYILERDHLPAEYGSLTYNAHTEQVKGTGERTLLAAQARAFAVACES